MTKQELINLLTDIVVHMDAMDPANAVNNCPIIEARIAELEGVAGELDFKIGVELAKLMILMRGG